MKKQKGITLISLIITIVLLLIIAGTTVYTSVDRFKINNLKKMYNDIELLDDKVNNYYLKYGGLPVIKDVDNNPVSYTHTAIDFNKDVNDNNNYYIIDLSAIGNITLSYGKDGYENPNGSDDVYIINEKSHTVYYVRGIEYTDGNLYHSKKVDGNINEDTVPPTTPEIKVVEGDEIIENNYETNVTLEFVPGKDNDSGVNKTTYSINGSEEKDINDLENGKYEIKDKGKYNITLRTYDNSNNISEITKNIFIGIEYLESTGTQYVDTGIRYNIDNSYKINASTSITKTVTEFQGNGWDGGGAWGYRYNTGEYSIGGSGDSGIVASASRFDEIIMTFSNGDKSLLYINNDLAAERDLHTNWISYASYKNYMIFATASSNSITWYANQRIKFYKIYENNTLVRDYIPVIDENGVAGLYDKVEGKFYYNQGTGEFKTNLDE